MPKTKDEPKPAPGQHVVKVRRKKRREISRSEAHKATLGIKSGRTTLQIALIAIGLVLVGIALAYNFLSAINVNF